MAKNNNKQKEKPLAGISMKIACGSKMALKIEERVKEFDDSFTNYLFVLKSAQN